MNFSLFHQIPMWLDFAIFVVVLLAALEVGFRIGVRCCDAGKDPAAESGQLVLTALFGLLGLMLAFTFGSGLTQHKARKQAVVAEANVLGTAYLRAGLVAEPGRSELRKALLDYAHTRRGNPGQSITLDELKARVAASEAAKGKLWPATEKIVRGSPAGPIEASLVESVNAVLDSGALRLAAVVDTLPPVVLMVLLLMATVTVALAGFSAGVAGHMSRWRSTILALVLGAIMLVILDFDRPNLGFIQVSSSSMETAIAEMEAEQ